MVGAMLVGSAGLNSTTDFTTSGITRIAGDPRSCANRTDR